jgi:lysyl-tRNA synthetase, class II
MTNQVERDRRQALGELRERGVEPFAYRYDVTHHAADARTAFEAAESDATLDEEGLGAAVRIGGRLTSLRSHGKASFADLADRSGRIQLFFRRNVVGEEAYDLLDLLHVGDWVGVGGRTMRTRAGEVSVLVESFELLSKSIRPLP